MIALSPGVVIAAPLVAVLLSSRRDSAPKGEVAASPHIRRGCVVVTAERRRIPMNDFQAVADRVEIEALRAEFTDAGMMHDYDRFASSFTEDGVWRIPGVTEFTSRAEIRAGVERLQGRWEYFVQNAHPGAVEIDGDTARGRAYIAEFGRLHDGSSYSNFALYHDRYRRTPDGWKFAERSYEVRYLDTTPLAGSAPGGVR
jgi:ketosteroid isomerase-like protein